MPLWNDLHLCSFGAEAECNVVKLDQPMRRWLACHFLRGRSCSMGRILFPYGLWVSQASFWGLVRKLILLVRQPVFEHPYVHNLVRRLRWRHYHGYLCEYQHFRQLNPCDSHGPYSETNAPKSKARANKCRFERRFVRIYRAKQKENELGWPPIWGSLF